MKHQAYDWHTILHETGVRHHPLYKALERGDFNNVLATLSGGEGPYTRLDNYLIFGAAAIIGRNQQAASAALKYQDRLNDKTRAISLFFWAQEAGAHLQHLTAIGLLSPLTERHPNDPELCSLMAVSYQQAQQLKEGWAYLKRGLAHSPNNVGLKSAECNYLMAEGDTEGVKQAAQELLDIDPNNVTAFSMLSRIDPKGVAPKLITHFEALGANSQVPLVNRAGLMFDVGRIYDACGNYDSAFDAIEQANTLMQQIPQSGSAVVHEEAEIADFEQRAALLDQLTALETACAVTPVFIVGLPRTGSTLLDQALSSHPDAVSYGENGRIAVIIRHAARLLKAGKVAEATATMQQWRQQYLATALSRNTQPKFVIDKTLDNNRHMAFIRKLFPDAKFLHCQRDLMDTGLSIYFAPFLRSHGYATDLTAIAGMMSVDQAVMKATKAKGIGALDVHYEDMVGDAEANLKRICHYIGLDWHEDILNFHAKKRQVHTYSAHQVRRKIYSSSKGRWMNYASKLNPLRQALQHKGVAA